MGARVVRAFGRQQEEYKEFSEVNDDYTKVQVRAGKISALLNPATTVIMNFAIIGILWYGSKEVSVGILTQGEVVALVNYMNQIDRTDRSCKPDRGSDKGYGFRCASE